MLVGCAAPQPRTSSYKPSEPPQGIVLVADGAGGAHEASLALAAAVKKAGLPLTVTSFNWTHGVGRGIADMTDVEHAREEAEQLAGMIRRYRARDPNVPIYLVGYSAGAHVALEATRWLEPKSIERMILLAPAVASDYDVRPALAVSRDGIDAFISERDRLYLRLGTDLVGTADGQRGAAAAGRVGFDAPTVGASDPLARQLRQHPWNPSVAWTGNDGSHGGSLSGPYVRAYLLPLLDTSTKRN
jgi:pimeloyl-ACP methyl ester carboxylesterase